MKLLHISDFAGTGFGRVTKNVAGQLSKAWDVAVLGLSYFGDPHGEKYRVYPASTGGDAIGVKRFRSIVAKEKPDVVLVNSDPWVVSAYLDVAAMMPDCPPIVAYMPVDSRFQIKPAVGKSLSRLATAVWYTQFGAGEAATGGFRGAEAIIPHGIDLGLYGPLERESARAVLKLPVSRETFLVGNVNRNQPRKRLDLTIDYFGAWLKSRPDVNAALYLHCSAIDSGWDIPHLVWAHGLQGKVFWPKQLDQRHDRSFVEALMPAVYSAADVQVSTTLGEGFGLTTLESMACAVAQILPDYAALGEWPRGAVRYVPCTAFEAHSNYDSGGIGGVADKAAFLAALDWAHDHPDERRELGLHGRALVEQPQFRWEYIAAQFDAVLREAIERGVGTPLYDREAVPC